MTYDPRTWNQRFIKQGTVTAGDTVYLSPFWRSDSYRKATVVRTTKTLVVVKTEIGAEQTYRWQPRSEHYSLVGASRYRSSELVTEEHGESMLASEAKKKAVSRAQQKAAKATEPLSTTRWITRDKIAAAIAQLEEAAKELEDLGAE